MGQFDFARMKTKRIPFIFLMPISCALSQIASAVVIENDAVIGPLFGSGQYLTLSKSVPNQQGLFAIRIAPLSSSQFVFSYAGIAEEYGLFSVVPGMNFDPAFVLLNDPIVSNNGIDPGSSTQVFALNQSKYFGYWDDRLNGQTPDANDNYGWVRITRTASGLEASASATAIGGGIVVGTTTQIPEPASSVLISFGVFMLVVRRR